MNRRHAVLCAFVGLALSGPVFAGRVEPLRAPRPHDPLRRAVARGLAVVQKAARNYPSHRKCYSCHHQTLPLLAMTHAKAAGIRTDEGLAKDIIAFTRKSFRGRIDNLKAGKGIGGRATTVGYGLWTLQIAGEKPDDLSAAMVAFLLKTQERSGRWRPPSNRPPMEASRITCTLFAVYGMQEHRSESQKQAVASAGRKARAWLRSAPLTSTEDRVMLLFARHLLGAEDETLRSARRAVLERQREDGGWGQTAKMASDAYSTGQALFVLLQTTSPFAPRKKTLSRSERQHCATAIRKGVEFLLKTQQKDGSWFVQTRSRPVQVFFDNGDPHGKSQFISIPATAWSTAALAEWLRRARK